MNDPVLIAASAAVLMLSLALLLCGYRLLRGPSSADRILALDTMYINVLALLIASGIRFSEPSFFEAALVIGLLGFLGTVVLARFLLRGDIIE
ncbi:MAG: K+/H+ antiporter subunit F [Rhodobacteraceae bacterium]|nr:K+/H+ antiporter subunit F [Paracoccaceae bacterium]